MGRRGPVPQPAALKLLRGNPGKRAIEPSLQDVTPVSVPACPAFLTGDASREWTRVTAKMRTDGRISTLDRAVLTAYCLSWARMKAMANDPEIAIKTKQDEEKHLAALADKLGLTVVARMRLPAAPPKKDIDPFEAMLGRQA